MQPKKIALLARDLMEDKKGEEPIVLDISKQSSFTHFFVITHGNSAPHVKAIADHLLDSFKKQKVPVFHKEGLEVGDWIILDLGAVLVHVFHRDKRLFYNLESLWGDAKEVKK